MKSLQEKDDHNVMYNDGHCRTRHHLAGMTGCHAAAAGPRGRDNSAWVAGRKGKVFTDKGENLL